LAQVPRLLSRTLALPLPSFVRWSRQKERAEQAEKWVAAEAAIATAVNSFLQHLLGQADITAQPGKNAERDPDIKVSTLLDRASKQLEGKFAGQPLTEAAVRRTLGRAYMALAKYDEARQHLDRALALRSAALGANHPATLEIKNDLGELAWTQGKCDEAESLLREAIAGRTAQLGAGHVGTLQSKGNLAGLYCELDKFDRAEPLLREVPPSAPANRGLTPITP
jgi:eukaryotic-like serine/threonine-protein kinase